MTRVTFFIRCLTLRHSAAVRISHRVGLIHVQHRKIPTGWPLIFMCVAVFFNPSPSTANIATGLPRIVASCFLANKSSPNVRLHSALTTTTAIFVADGIQGASGGERTNYIWRWYGRHEPSAIACRDRVLGKNGPLLQL